MLAHPGGLSYLTITQWVPTVATKTRFFPEAPQLAPAYASQESVNLFGSLARRVSRRRVTSWTLLCRTLGKRLISSPTTELSVPTRAGGMAVATKELGDSSSPVLLPGGDGTNENRFPTDLCCVLVTLNRQIQIKPEFKFDFTRPKGQRTRLADGGKGSRESKAVKRQTRKKHIPSQSSKGSGTMALSAGCVFF